MMPGIWRALKQYGVVGINGRNLNYVLAYNPRKYYPLVDNKIETKRLAKEAGISTPELYKVIEYQGQIYGITDWLDAHKEFVIKPAHGSGGNGIMVIVGRTAEGYIKASGEVVTQQDLQYHLSKTLSGLYSLGGHPDQAIIEQKVNFDPMFEKVTYLGVPDIRVLVFQGVPAMAMVRLPTKQSDGKANLHMGGVGVGINMATGETLSGVRGSTVVDTHPDTGNSIHGIVIPQWQRLLEMSSRFYKITKLGYIGVDIVLDKDHGPMILELNARPGLAIQIANQEGLEHRLRKVEHHIKSLHTEAEKVAFAMEHFKPRTKAE